MPFTNPLQLVFPAQRNLDYFQWDAIAGEAYAPTLTTTGAGNGGISIGVGGPAYSLTSAGTRQTWTYPILPVIGPNRSTKTDITITSVFSTIGPVNGCGIESSSKTDMSFGIRVNSIGTSQYYNFTAAGYLTVIPSNLFTNRVNTIIATITASGITIIGNGTLVYTDPLVTTGTINAIPLQLFADTASGDAVKQTFHKIQWA